MYGPIWRALRGPWPVRLLQATVLVLAVVAMCFLWLFPMIAPSMPFNDNTVDGPAPTPSSTTTRPSTTVQPSTTTRPSTTVQPSRTVQPSTTTRPVTPSIGATLVTPPPRNPTP